MRTARYRLLILSTKNQHMVSVTQIMVRDQDQAEMVATNKLRLYRLTRPEGQAWDHWMLGVKASPDGGWYHVATGDHTGAQWRSRDGHPAEGRRGTQ